MVARIDHSSVAAGHGAVTAAGLPTGSCSTSCYREKVPCGVEIVEGLLRNEAGKVPVARSCVPDGNSL